MILCTVLGYVKINVISKFLLPLPGRTCLITGALKCVVFRVRSYKPCVT